MGFDLNRFQGDVDEELVCPICSGVLEDPVQAPECEHAFCEACIQEWVSRQPTCPVDRLPITFAQLRPVPRILRNLLSRLCITCDNKSFGCTSVMKLDLLAAHLEECLHNPKRPIRCEQGCGLVIPKDELKDHNCVRELRSLIHTQQQKLGNFQQGMAELRFQISEQKRELQLLKSGVSNWRPSGQMLPSHPSCAVHDVKDFMCAMRISNPAMRAIADRMERDEVIRWSNTLVRARVTRWGGMISTPEVALRSLVKRALSECNCPPHIVDDLMERAHESRWPPGLSSLETRQANRRQYENFVCKRIPGRQAVVVLQCDNSHMSEDMMVEPGLVMIFAHGSNFSRGALEDVPD